MFTSGTGDIDLMILLVGTLFYFTPKTKFSFYDDCYPLVGRYSQPLLIDR